MHTFLHEPQSTSVTGGHRHVVEPRAQKLQCRTARNSAPRHGFRRSLWTGAETFAIHSEPMGSIVLSLICGHSGRLRSGEPMALGSGVDVAQRLSCLAVL